MRIATVDSSCSVLDENLMPTSILSTAALVVDPPYLNPVPGDSRHCGSVRLDE